MSATRTYKVQGMRVLLPTPKTLENTPDLVFTVTGKFFTEDGKPLSIPQKRILQHMVEDVKVDIAKGILVLPAGQRGAPKRESASQEDVNRLLSGVRNK